MITGSFNRRIQNAVNRKMSYSNIYLNDCEFQKRALSEIPYWNDSTKSVTGCVAGKSVTRQRCKKSATTACFSFPDTETMPEHPSFKFNTMDRLTDVVQCGVTYSAFLNQKRGGNVNFVSLKRR